MKGPSYDLQAVAADEELLSALASGSRPGDGDVGDLLAHFRGALDAAAASLEPLATGPSVVLPAIPRRHSRWGGRRVAGLAAAATLALAGTSVAAAAATPGTTFYPVRQMIFGVSTTPRDAAALEREASSLLDHADDTVRAARARAWSTESDRSTVDHTTGRARALLAEDTTPAAAELRARANALTTALAALPTAPPQSPGPAPAASSTKPSPTPAVHRQTSPHRAVGPHDDHGGSTSSHDGGTHDTTTHDSGSNDSGGGAATGGDTGGHDTGSGDGSNHDSSPEPSPSPEHQTVSGGDSTSDGRSGSG